jgi:hypothetical protein
VVDAAVAAGDEPARDARRYLSRDEYRYDASGCVPPLLYSFPGSSNTWARVLLDHATGVYTGSINTDPSLKPVLRAKRRCDASLSFITWCTWPRART